MCRDSRNNSQVCTRRWVAPAYAAALLVSAALAHAADVATSQPVAHGTKALLAPNATWTPSVARWIWLPGEEKPANAYVEFRKAFTLDAVPAKASVHASADCKYLLWINGTVVGRGPIVTDPAYKQVDVYDVASLLRPGDNVVATLVLQRHNKTSRLWPVRGGFMLQLNADATIVGTDGSWKARLADEYQSDVPYMTHQYGQQEWLDARKASSGWNAPGFNDAAWSSAVVVDSAEKYWPAALELRELPHMLREVIHPVCLVSYFTTNTQTTTTEPARQLEIDFPGSSIIVRNEENISRPGSAPTVFQASSGSGIAFVVDLGEEMLGYPFIDMECPAGVTVDLGHGEVLSRNRIQTVLIPNSTAEQRYADRYITREGRQRWEIYDTKGCRYLEIHFRGVPWNDNGIKVAVHEVGLIRSRAPIEHKVEFSCSDELLNRIFDICRRTADVKCQDWHICDAQREQNQWLEPYQDMLYAQVYGRCDLVRQTLHHFARGQLPLGFMLSTIPTIHADIPTPMNQYIFSTYAFPLIGYVDWLYGGKDPRQAAWLECSDKAFSGLFKYMGPDGVLVNTPGYHWVEWSGLDARPMGCGRSAKKSWEVTFFSALMVLTLERTADMAAAEGRDDLAVEWRKRAAGLRVAANRRYWSDARGAYVDGIYDGAASDTVSQSTNAIAVLARLGDRQRLLTALDTVGNPKRCDVPCAINNMALYHEALESMDRDQGVPDRIRTKWKKMLDLGATTTWEQEQALERSNGCCFGFAAHPLNYMVRNLLGVVPLEAGYRRFSVQIAPLDLSHARGKVPTPYGTIAVEWTMTKNKLTVKLTVPQGCEAVVAHPRLPRDTAATSVRLDGQAVSLTPQQVAVCTFLRETRQACSVGPGQHTLAYALSVAGAR